MGLFDSTNEITTVTVDGTQAPNLSVGSNLNGGGGTGGGGALNVAYSPGGVLGTGSIVAQSGGVIDQSLRYSTNYQTQATEYSTVTAPSINIGSPGAGAGAVSTPSFAPGGSILGLTWQAWFIFGGAVTFLIWRLRK